MQGLFKDSGIIPYEQMIRKIELFSEIKSPFTKDRIVYLPDKGRAVFIGDIHGDVEAVVSIVRQVDFFRAISQGEETYIVFLGDYTDRGRKNVETINEILSLGLAYPQNVILLRGNHEEEEVVGRYGTRDDFERAYGRPDYKLLFAAYCQAMARLPVVVKTANGIIGVHGGIPNNDIASLDCLNGPEGDRIAREMVWNDPITYITERRESKRGEEFTAFGEPQFDAFIKAAGANVMIRSHEYLVYGLCLYFNNRLATIFSNGSSRSESSHYRHMVACPVFFQADLSKKIERFEKDQFTPVAY